MKTRILITTLFTGILLLGFMSVSSERIQPYILKSIPNDADGDGVVDSQDNCGGEDASYFDRDGDGCIDDPIGMRHIEYWGNEHLPVTYVIHEDGAPGITDGSDFTAIQEAIAAWPAVTGTDLTVTYSGTTTDGEAAVLDQINTVTFEDTDYDFGQYVLAVGVATSFTEATEHNSTVYRPGQIVDADMMFNPNKNFKTATQGFGQDIKSVATHEAGHLFGVSHSAVMSSTMFFILPYGTAATTLETEDETVFLKAYPNAATLSSANRLSGRVVDGSSVDPINPDPVPGAIVYAIDAVGDTLGCDYTMLDGSYEFFGLPDGSYYVAIYPLNGTSPIAGLVPGYINPWVDTTAVTVFVPEYYNTGDATGEDPLLKDAVAVSGGADVTGIDIVTNIDTTAPTVLNTSPETSDTGVRIDAAMVIRFSEAVKTSSLQNNFVIREQGAGPNPAESGRAVIYRDDSLMSFTQDTPYKFNTTYVCSLKTGITDLFDNPLANPHVVTFTTELQPSLAISSLVPNKGVPGSIVVINGAGFGWTVATNKVYFKDDLGAPLEATVEQASPNRIVVTVPAGAATGDVYVESGGDTSNNLTFTILSATEIARGFEAGVSTLGGTPRALTVLPNGLYAYVATDDGFSAVGVDPGESGYLNSDDVPVTGGLTDMDAVPSSNRVYAVSRADSSISVIYSDPGDPLQFNSVISTLDVLAEPLGMIIDAMGRRAYVPTTGGEIQIWDVQLGSATYWRQVGAFTSPDANVRGKMAIDPLRDDLLALTGTGKLLIFDLGPDTLRAEVGVGPDPRDVVVDPAGQRAYVSDGSGVVSIVALGTSPFFVQDITTGGSPRGMTITPAGLWLYEANRNLDVIDVIDLNETSSTWRSVAATITQGDDPVDVDLSPEGFYAFSVVEGPKQLVVTTIGLGPTLNSLSKRAGPRGAKLVLAGYGFGWMNSSIRVNFENESGGITAVVPDFSTFSSITATVPADAVSGPVNMVMWVSDVMNPIPQYSNALYFEVLDTASTGGFRFAAAIPPNQPQNYLPKISISPLGDQMALAKLPDEVVLMDIDPDSPTMHQILKTTDVSTQPLALIEAMAFTPDGKTLYVADMEENDLFYLDVNRHSSTYGDVLGQVQLHPVNPSAFFHPQDLAVSPDGERLLCDDITKISIIDIIEGSNKQNTVVDTIQVDVVGDMAYHPAGLYVYITDMSSPPMLRVLDMQPFSPTFKRFVHSMPLEADFIPEGTLSLTPRSLSFSPDGSKCLVSAYRSDLAPPARVIFTIGTTDPTTPSILGRYYDAYFSANYAEFLDVSPAGNRAVYHSNMRGFMYFDATPDSNIVLLSQHATHTLAQFDQEFTPDGSRLYSLEALNDTIFIYDFFAAQTIDYVSGGKQVGVVNEPLAAPLRVQVTDSGGTGVKGVAIQFVANLGDGFFAASDSSVIVVVTDSDGYAEAELTCGPVAALSSQRVYANAFGLEGTPVVFTASTVEDPETLPLLLAEVLPPDSSSNVSATTTILATFSRPVDPSTVDDTSLYLHAKNDATHVAVVYGFTDNNRKVSLTPTGTLAYNTEYEIEVLSGSGGVEDAAGGPLASGETSLFETQSPPPLTLASVSPPSATVGVTLVLAGTGFDPVAANNTVYFNSLAAIPFEADADLLKVVIPNGAVSGTIKVAVGANETNTLPFTVIIPTTSPVDEVIANVGTGAATKSVTINPDGTIAYTVSPEGDTVIPIDIQNEQSLQSINVGDHPIAIVMHPSGNYAYVANFNSNSVSIIGTNPDSSSYHQVDETVIVGTNPIDLAVTPAGDRVVTANAGANSLSFIDGDGQSASHHTVVATVGTGAATKSVTINPDGTRIYIGTDTGYIVMGADDQGVVATVGTGKATKSLTINPDGSLLVILTTEGDVLIYNIDPNAGPNENTVVATVGKGSGTKAVTINPDGTLLYLIQENSNDVIVVSLEIIGSVGVIEPGAVIPPFQVITTVIDSVTAGENPSAGGFDPSGTGLMIITNAGDSTVTLLNASSLPWDIVEATISVDPRTLNLTSRGRWITGSIELPLPLRPEDIDISTVLLQDTVPAVPDKWEICDCDSNGVDELIVKFDRAFFQAIMPQGEFVPVTITGVAGTKQFVGHDTIRTIRPTVTHPTACVVTPNLVTTVTWESPDGYQVDYVDVHWSPDDGETWYAIVEGISDDGTADWLTPAEEFHACRVMVTLFRDGDDIGAGMSPEAFSIAQPVAVTLVDFGGVIDKGIAVLEWRTTMENRVEGFHVLRSDTEEDGYERVTKDVVPSNGDPEGSAYTYTDDGVHPNQTYYYMLEEVSERGDKQLFGPCKVTYKLKFALDQNHPNPFNPSTKIAFSIPSDSHVELMVYDVAGRLVRTLVDEPRRANRYTAVWDGKDDRGTQVASGVYFYRIQAGKHRATKKMVLLK